MSQYYKIVIRRKYDNRCVQVCELPAMDDRDAEDQALERYPEYEDSKLYSITVTQLVRK